MFEVSDVITGKQIATERYSITVRGAIMEVVEVHGDMIRVRVVGLDESMASASIEMENSNRGRSWQVRLTASHLGVIQYNVERGSEFSVNSRYFEAYTPEDHTSKLNDFLDEI